MELSTSVRPATPDNAPLIGCGPADLVLATGHYRNGVLLAPVTADAIAALVVDEVVLPEVAEFDPARFASVSGGR